MNRRPHLAGLLALAALAAGGCEAPRTFDLQPAGADQDADVLARADREFAAAVAVGGLDAWVSWFTPDATKFGLSGEEVVVGRAAIAEADAVMFADPDRHIVWEPDLAGWLEPGERGYTRGAWRFVGQDEDGQEVTVASGRYLTLWVKTDDGWRVELDVGSRDD
jgi:ketosteroid isomerase-like protein